MKNAQGEKIRFGRSQKFRLATKGTEAVEAYVLMVEKARSGEGRAQFDAARAAWSAPRGLRPEDGLYLMEFKQGERTLTDVVRGLEDCAQPKDVKAAVEWLLEHELLEPVPEPVEPAAPPRRYW